MRDITISTLDYHHCFGLHTSSRAIGALERRIIINLRLVAVAVAVAVAVVVACAHRPKPAQAENRGFTLNYTPSRGGANRHLRARPSSALRMLLHKANQPANSSKYTHPANSTAHYDALFAICEVLEKPPGSPAALRDSTVCVGDNFECAEWLIWPGQIVADVIVISVAGSDRTCIPARVPARSSRRVWSRLVFVCVSLAGRPKPRR